MNTHKFKWAHGARVRWLIVIAILAAVGWSLCAYRQEASLRPPIDVTTLKPHDRIKSPLQVKGRARGWYFEGSFPVYVFDANGVNLGGAPAQAQGEWMTPDWVAFDGTVIFTTPTTETGFVVFQKDNPSGIPELDEEYRVPVRFVEIAR